MLFLLLGYHLRVEILIGAGQLARKFFTTINITVCIRILNSLTFAMLEAQLELISDVIIAWVNSGGGYGGSVNMWSWA